MKPVKKITTKQALTLLQEKGVEVSYPTVAQWVREGKFKGAEREETERGPVWRIPLESVENFQKPMMGRPRKKAQSEKALKRAGKKGARK